MADDELHPALAALKRRRQYAENERQKTQPLRDDVYKYVLPYRKSDTDGTGGPKIDDVFDHTAIAAAFRFAGVLQQELWPEGQQNFELEPGPGVPADQKDAWHAYLSNFSQVLQASFFDDGDFSLAYHESRLDLVAGTSALLMNSTAYQDAVWEPEAIPANELLLEGSGTRVTGIFWSRRKPVREVFNDWPNAQFSEDLKKLHANSPEEKIVVHFDSVLDRHREASKTRWKHTIWCDKQKEAPIHTFKTRTSIWAIERYYRVPGEVWGRGVGMLAMPSIKTANTAARLQLMAASIAMLGIYTAVDDQVFNPDNSPVAPGVFWKVSRNGGPLGPSVQRFPDPRIDLTGLVMADIQAGVKETMMDEALPATGAAVKSATEILERVKRLASDHIGAYARLVKEGVIAYVRRAMEIAYDKQLVQQTFPIDQVLVRVKVKSPLAIAHEMARVQKIVQWLEMVIGILQDPSRADEYAHLDRLLIELGRSMNVPENLIVKDDERDKIRQAKQEQQMAMAAAQAGMQAVSANTGKP